MHAVNKRNARFLQRLGGGHVSQDHEFLDQPMRLQPLGAGDAVDSAISFKQDLALGQVEIERLALVAGPYKRLVSGIERRQHGLHQRVGLLVGAPAYGELCLLV